MIECLRKEDPGKQAGNNEHDQRGKERLAFSTEFWVSVKLFHALHRLRRGKLPRAPLSSTLSSLCGYLRFRLGALCFHPIGGTKLL